MPCNPSNPKAQNPLYICNENTNRWILRRNARRAEGAVREGLHAFTVRELLELPQAVHIKHRHRMRKAEFITAIQQWRRGGGGAGAGAGGGGGGAGAGAGAGAVVAAQQKKQAPNADFQQECKLWETKCPSDATLEGDEWCSFGTADGFLRTPDWSFCTTIDEIISHINSALTTYDYIIGAPKLDLPRNPYNRQYIPLSFYRSLYEKIKRLPRSKQAKIIRDFPIAAVFLFRINRGQPELFEFIDKYRHQSAVRKSIHLTGVLGGYIILHGKHCRLSYDINHNDQRLVWSWHRGVKPHFF